MRENTLLYLGAGIASFTIIVSIVTGLIYSQKKEFSDFKYGAFYIHSIFGIAIGSTLSGILFYFQFLSWDLAIFSSSLLLGFQVGFLLLYKFMEKRNKLFFFLVSIPCLVIFYLAPIFIFNMVYIFKIYKPVSKNPKGQETWIQELRMVNVNQQR